MGGRLLDYLGQGDAADRPLAADMPARIDTGAVGFYFAQDTLILSVFNQDTLDWFEVDMAALAGLMFQSLPDVDFSTPPTDGQVFVWDTTTSKLIPYSIPALPTTEEIQDIVGGMIINGTRINASYNDVTGLIELEGTVTQYTDEMAQDAIGALIAAGVHVGVTPFYDDATGSLSFSLVLADVDARIAAASIGDLSDVDIITTPPAEGDTLVFRSGEWVPEAPTGGAGGSGWNLQWGPLVSESPTANFATIDIRNNHPTLDFDAGVIESTIFTGILPDDYAGNGVEIDIYWAATSATAGDCVWQAAIERIDLSTLDIDADSFAAVQSVTTTAPSTSGMVVRTTIPFTNGAQMDSLTVGELFRLKITRDATNVADTMTGDAEVLRVRMQAL